MQEPGCQGGRADSLLIEYHIEGKLPDLNSEIDPAKKHWSNYARTKKAWTTRCALAARRLKPVKAVHVHCTWRSKTRRIDPDNLAFAVKYILDGLVVAKVLPDDSWQHVKSIHHTFVVDKKHQGVDVRLTPDNGDV